MHAEKRERVDLHDDDRDAYVVYDLVPRFVELAGLVQLAPCRSIEIPCYLSLAPVLSSLMKKIICSQNNFILIESIIVAIRTCHKFAGPTQSIIMHVQWIGTGRGDSVILDGPGKFIGFYGVAVH